VALALVHVLVTSVEAPAPGTAMLVAWVLLSLLAWGGLFERKRWAPALEVARLVALPLVLAIALPTVTGWWSLGLAGTFGLGGCAWLWRLEKPSGRVCA
jgi:hypothetical protein